MWATDVTFTFNTDAGLAELGISKPSASAGTELGTKAYTLSGVSMAATTASGKTATRVWNSSGTLDLRIYTDGTFTFTAPGNITKVVLAGNTVSGFTANVGSFSSGTWTGEAATVVLTATGTEKINTITVTYAAATPKYALTFTNSVTGGTISVTKGSNTVSSGDEFEEDDVLDIVATPAEGYDFTSWSATGDATIGSTTNATTTLTMPAAAVTLSATFTPQEIISDIELDNVENGTIAATIGGIAVTEAKVGDVVTLTAAPAEGYGLGSWLVLDNNADEVTVTTVDENTATFVMPATAVTVSAEFLAKHTVTYYVAGVSNTAERVHGATLSLDAPASVGGMAFAGWSSANDAASPLFVANTTAVNDNMTVYAIFTAVSGANSYQLVEADQDDWRGDYLIAYSSTVFANGKTYGTSGLGSSVNPTTDLNGKVVNASWGDKYYVTLEAVDDDNLSDGYVLKTQDGYYNYQTSDANGLSGYSSNKSTAANHAITVNYVSSEEINLTLNHGNVFRYNTSISGFRFYKSATYTNQAAVYLYKKITSTPTYSLGTPKSVTVGDSKYATYCSNEGLDFSASDVKAYTAKVDGNKVVLTQVANDIVPANTGVILYCETAGNYDIPVIKTSATVSDNEMVGVTESTSVAWTTDDKYYNYILQNGVFNNANGGNLKANRAYLHTTYDVTAPGARALVMVFDGETTGIKDNKRETITNSREFYNLNGQRVAQPTKGLYIVNGNKVIIK